MHRLFIFILITVFCCGCAKQERSQNPIKEKEYLAAESLKEKCAILLDTLCSKEYMGRKTGSEYDAKAFSYICRVLSMTGYDYQIQEFLSKGGQSILRNIIVTVPGKTDSVIVIGSHYDGAFLSDKTHHYPAANDNASGVVTNIALLDSIKNSGRINTPTIVCGFWDGEEVFDDSWVQGSSYYIRNNQDKELIQYYINLDSIGHDHVLYIKHQGHGSVEHALSRILSNHRLEYSPIDMNAESGGSSDYVPFSHEGIPYLSFGDHNGDMCSFHSHTTNDKVEAISLDRIIIHVRNIMDLICL